MIGGLRAVKDPLLAARAARALPPSSRVRITCVGPILEPAYDALVARELAENPRFRYRGALPPADAACVLAASDLLALTSRTEGGANVVGEAVVAGVPIVATSIDGTIGLLGADYPGYVPVDDVAALARAFDGAETRPQHLATLRAATVARRPLFAPERERDAWATLLAI